MNRRRHLVLPVLGLCVILVANASTSLASDDVSARASSNAPPILVVVDLSSSMNETDANGKIKIQGAREAFAELLTDLGGSTRLGVWTYSDDGSCGAGALTTQFQPVAGIDVDAVVGSWDPTGDTPTAQALQAAARTIALAGGDTIILISDGESNCGADPCEAARELASQGIEVKFHAVGFDISEQGRSELECITSATGGTYTDAANSDELAAIIGALAQVSITVDLTAEVLDNAMGTSYPFARIEVSATATNTSIQTVRDLDLTLRFEGDRRLALIDGTRTLPSLEGGSSHTTTWTFSVPIDCEDYLLEYSAFARIGPDPVAIDTGTTTVSGRSDSVYCLLISGGNLAILGDSYSSGEGAPEYDPGTNEVWNRCRRGQTYGRADRVGDLADGSPNDPLTVLACSGAIIHDLLLPHGEHQIDSATGPLLESQLKQLENLPDDVDVVVLTISGNDVGFASIAAACATGDCIWEESSALDSAAKAVDSLQRPLERALRIIESTVNADRERPVQFVLLPYVDLLSGDASSEESQECAVHIVADLADHAKVAGIAGLTGAAMLYFSPVLGALVTTGAGITMVWADLVAEITPEEAARTSVLQTSLNAALRRTVNQLKLEGRPVYFAESVSTAFDGHTLCSDDPWAHGIRTTEVAKAAVRPVEALHPNAEGYRAIWRSLLEDARTWSITGRNVATESSVDGGQLCPETGDYRILSYVDFLNKSQLELQRGECIIVVGGPTDARPPDGEVDWSIEDLSIENLSELTDEMPGAEEEYGLRSWIAFYIHSEPELLGVARPDENGTFREILWIPDDLPTGHHTLSALAPDGSGSVEVLSRPVVLVDEPTAPYKAVFGMALAAALIGVGILVLVPRRSTRRARRTGDGPPT